VCVCARQEPMFALCDAYGNKDEVVQSRIDG
jgi:hypothetical protein